MRKIHIKSVHTMDAHRMRQVGSGKKASIQRVLPKDNRFKVGMLMWLPSGIYRLAEISNPKRCNKKVRHMIIRPVEINKLDPLKNYTIYEIAGAGI